MTPRRLAVWLPGRRVGELVQARGGLVTWTPERAWEAEGQHPRLGAAFLSRPGPRQVGTGLPAWFDNLLPERGTELRRRLCALHSLREGQSFALLHALGRDLLGAVEVRATDEGAGDDTTAEPTSDGPPSERGASGALRMGALTGVQMKFSMSMVGEGLTLDAYGGRSHWIVKLPAAQFPELSEVEQATMTWAREAGFEVPEHFTPQVAALEGIPKDWLGAATLAMAVKRFDRRDDGTKIHQEDLCQALDLPPGDKNGDGTPRVAFDGALRFVTDLAGDAEGREMARRLGFMLASGNGDAHLKNWSLVWGAATRPSLAPCYDLVTTIAWPELGWERDDGPTLALALGGERLFRRVGSVALDAFAKAVGRSWVRDEVLDGIARAVRAWPRVANLAPERMRRAVAVHWERVPVLEDLAS